jgi:hypothetical protein
MGNGILVNVDSNNGRRSSGEDPRAVSLAACEIENALLFSDFRSVGVPVKMLVSNYGFPNPGKKAFTGPFEHSAILHNAD